jgi:hypothetical protein
MAIVGRNLQFLPFYIGTREDSLKWFVIVKVIWIFLRER